MCLKFRKLLLNIKWKPSVKLLEELSKLDWGFHLSCLEIKKKRYSAPQKSTMLWVIEQEKLDSKTSETIPK